MALCGWKRLVAGAPWFRGPGRYPIPAYSEFMPPPRLGRKPCGRVDGALFRPDDPLGWQVSEHEEALQFGPGLRHLADVLVHALEHLGHGRAAHGFALTKLERNPYWPQVLADRAGRLPHERYVVLAPLAFSQTQDDKGRVRWTLFGGSEQGPSRAFWKGFFLGPEDEVPRERALEFFRGLLGSVYGERIERLGDLRRAGFRVLPGVGDPRLAYDRSEPLPSWAGPLILPEGKKLGRVKYLLTFRPFGLLPRPVQRAYLAGDLHLLPFPGSMIFWAAEGFLRLRRELPLAMQIPLQHAFPRHEHPAGVRVPQSGWMHEPRPDLPDHDPSHGPLRNTYRRTHRWARIHRHEDELGAADHEDRVAHVLFSTMPDDVGLYGKPMARNVQIYTRDFRLLLDGPRADRDDLERAAAALHEGGSFGYRFQFPAMRVGLREVYWHRPLAAYLSAQTGAAEVLPDAPLGYLTAYRADRPDPARPIELWPRLLERGPQLASLHGFSAIADHHQRRITIENVRKVLDAWTALGERPLQRSFARALVTLPTDQGLDHWLAHIEESANEPAVGHELADELRRRIEPQSSPGGAEESDVSPALTYRRTASRRFEAAYWRAIARLAGGRYLNKDNADCILDPASRSLQKHHHRDLEALGEYLLGYYEQVIAKAGMAGKAAIGDLPFRWQTDFDFPWSGGWRKNQEGEGEERDLIVAIPGRDRRRAVIMADHYDTAYMEDRYDKARGGVGARLAAAGADDNHSATAALMLAAPVLLELSRGGLLGCDVWLVHLTGEEFPSDCMGARHLAQSIVEGAWKVRLRGPGKLDPSQLRIQGVFVLDMIAHNNDHDPDVFQISPGSGRESLELAREAHLANAAWNAGLGQRNRRPGRRGCRRGRRCPDGRTMPATALHLPLHGEVRPPKDPRSSLYNTDGQIFSDAGIPVVLFMENYDINRVGYHDSHDTMANIDLDYGAALAAIAIESVARAANMAAGH